MNTREIWEKALTKIESTIDSSVGYRVYIKKIEPVSHTDTVFTVCTMLEIGKNMVNIRYRKCIEQALRAVTGRGYTLEVMLKSELPENIPYDDTEIIRGDNRSDTLNPKYTFEGFVVGDSNRYAAAVAKNAAENPGDAYNPFFLYGNSGLGKTHLMHANGNEIKKNHPDYNIIYITSEQFMNEFIDSIVSKSPMDFKHKYRSADVLLIDDVQFLEKKEGLQEEVFHTFNDLYSRNKQIVLTSDRMPNELVKLEERLRTRFAQGITFDISIPNFETRVAILKKKADEHLVSVPDEVMQYIADRIKTNIRELEGALMKMISISEISAREIDIALAEEVVDSLLPNGGAVKLTPERIIEKVCTYYGVSKEEILGKGRPKRISLPRQVAMYLCSSLGSMSYSMIGDAFGGKDRTTAMHNVRKISEDIKTDPSVKEAVDYITKDLDG